MMLKFFKIVRDFPGSDTGLNVFLEKHTLVLQQDLGSQVVPDFIGNDFIRATGLKAVHMGSVDLNRIKTALMFLQTGIFPDTIEDFQGIVTEDITDSGIDFVLLIDVLKVR